MFVSSTQGVFGLGSTADFSNDPRQQWAPGYSINYGQNEPRSLPETTRFTAAGFGARRAGSFAGRGQRSWIGVGGAVASGSAAVLKEKPFATRSAAGNLLTSPDDVTNGSFWSAAGATLPQTTPAPYGLTAALIQENTGTSNHDVSQNLGVLPVKPYSASVIAKGAGRFLVLYQSTDGNGVAAVFNLTNGTSVVWPAWGGGSYGGSASTTDLGGGWWECRIEGVAPLPAGGWFALYLRVNPNNTTDTPYTGDGVSGVWVTHARFVQDSTIAHGFAQGAIVGGSAAYLKEKSFAVIGAQPGDNFLNAPEDIANATYWTLAAATAPQTTPAPYGLTATLLREDTSTADHQVQQTGTPPLQPYSASVIAKLGAGSRHLVLYLTGNAHGVSAVFNLADGSTTVWADWGGGSLGGVATTTDLGGGWWECRLESVGIFQTVGNLFLGFGLRLNPDDAAGGPFAGDGASGIWLTHARLVAGQRIAHGFAQGSIIGGAATIAHLVDRRWTGAGGATASGSAAYLKIKPVLGAGTATAGGTSPKLKIKPLQAAGGGVAGGASATLHLVDRRWTGAGGATSSGAAAYLKIKAVLGVGGGVASGVSAVLKRKDVLGAGGAVAGGAAARLKIKPALAAGGAVAAGSGARLCIKVVKGAGGAVSGGAAQTSGGSPGSHSWTGAGGAVGAGSAALLKDVSPRSVGTATVAGAAAVSRVRSFAAAGGALAAGVAAIALVKVGLALGGAVAGGAGVTTGPSTHFTYPYAGHGGAIASGHADAFILHGGLAAPPWRHVDIVAENRSAADAKMPEVRTAFMSPDQRATTGAGDDRSESLAAEQRAASIATAEDRLTELKAAEARLAVGAADKPNRRAGESIM